MSLVPDLRRAVKTLGGSNRTAKLVNVGRVRLEYWMKTSLPHWAVSDAQRIIDLAADPENWPELNRAIHRLGGPQRTIKLAAITMARLNYLLEKNWPNWAEPDVRRIVSLAADKANWAEVKDGEANNGKGRQASRHGSQRLRRAEGRHSGGAPAPGSR